MGFELALFCDLILAADGTMLGLPETRIGIVPLAGGVQPIAPRAGFGRSYLGLGSAIARCVCVLARFWVSGSWLRDLRDVLGDERERVGLELGGVGQLVEGRVGAGGLDAVAGAGGEL